MKENVSFAEILLNRKYFFYANILVVSCFLITQFIGKIKIIGILSLLSVVLLVIDMLKSKLYKSPLIILIYFVIGVAGLAMFFYHLFYSG